MKWTKRLFDIIISFGGLVCLLPLFTALALLIKLWDKGPVFFKQERIGYQGRPFKIWKFRTMIPDADKKGALLTAGNDERITPLGRALRKWKLDELPQLLNVLKGEMSLVGPRPEVERYVALYSKEQKKVLELVPGITDPASVKYRNESDLLAGEEDPEMYYCESIMPDKISINLKYADNSNLYTDVSLLVNTLLKVAGGNDEGKKISTST